MKWSQNRFEEPVVPQELLNNVEHLSILDMYLLRDGVEQQLEGLRFSTHFLKNRELITPPTNHVAKVLISLCNSMPERLFLFLFCK